MTTIVLTKEMTEAMAFDVAQGYFSDAQLCIRHRVTIRQLEQIKAQAEFQREVDEVKRTIEDGGEVLVYKARVLAEAALTALGNIIEDDEISAQTRAKAANDILDVAGVKRGRNASGPGTGDGGFRLTIETNLSMGTQEKGVYEVTAVPVDPEIKRVEQTAIEHGRKWSKSDLARGLDLIG